MPRKAATKTPSLEETIHNLRVQVFNNACRSLTVARAVLEEATALDPRTQEISEAVTILRRAVVDNGLELIRPLVSQLKVPGVTAEKVSRRRVPNGETVQPAAS